MKIISSLLVASLLCVGSAYAQKPDHAGNQNKVKKQKKHKQHKASKGQDTVSSYYKSLPPGLQKKMNRTGSLPPGWSKKVSVGQRVPDEYIKIAVPAPDDLRIKLKIDSKSKLLMIANKIIKVEIGTNRLLAEFSF